jgi:phospholipid/cholesterol/gamma-HCH transport system substrate-binding protein
VKAETRVGIFVIIAMGVFFYLSINIGAFRLDEAQYYPYRAYFEDTGGLDLKSPVKIAGVEVGWVDEIILQSGGTAEVHLKIKKTHNLARNTYATIQQEGLIGTKSIDVDPGDITTGILPPGSTLAMPGKSPASVGELLEQFRDIASGIQDLVASFKNVFSTRKGEENLKLALNNVADASNKIANFSGVLERVLHKNENNINSMLVDFKKTAFNLQDGIPKITDDFHSITGNADKLTLAFADDTLPAISDASDSIGNVFNKVNDGKGVIGSLVNDDDLSQDVKNTVKGLEAYFGKTSSLGILIDMHVENMIKTKNDKGYLEIKLRPSHDYFYNIQLVSDSYGSVRKTEDHYKRFDTNGKELPTSLLTSARDKIEFADKVETIQRIKNDILFSFQFGKRFNRLALRIGMFENAFGMGCDYYIPLKTNKLHWITTIEAFDFMGTKRVDDSRPYIKWMNKLHFLKHVYTTFGLSDIYSKKTASPFFGGGIRFNDDDLKYILSAVPIGKMVK